VVKGRMSKRTRDEIVKNLSQGVIGVLQTGVQTRSASQTAAADEWPSALEEFQTRELVKEEEEESVQQ
jgi:hypothetical protein